MSRDCSVSFCSEIPLTAVACGGFLACFCGVCFIKISAEFCKPTEICCQGPLGSLSDSRQTEMQRSFSGVCSRSLIKRPCVSSSTSRPGWTTCKNICGQAKMCTLFGRRNRRLRAPILDAGSDRRNARGCNERQSPEFYRVLANSRTLRPRRPTKRPYDTRRAVTSQRLGPGSRHARSHDESTLETYCRGDDQRRGRAPRQRRRHSVKAEPCCVEGDTSTQKAGSERKERRGQRRRCKPRQGCDLRATGPACPSDCGRRFSRVGGPCSLH